MAFYRNPIIEEPPKCIVCGAVMYGQSWNDGLVCSATCADLWIIGSERALREQYGEERHV